MSIAFFHTIYCILKYVQWLQAVRTQCETPENTKLLGYTVGRSATNHLRDFLMSSIIHYNQAVYLTSATTITQLPVDSGREVAFIGRSNAGKSSALNTVTNVKGLARTSASPGRTQMINFFGLDETRRLVDLPGYGFANVPLAVKARWQQLTSDYFETRESLVGLMLVMDSRHPLQPLDQQMIAWCVDFQIPLHILLTKADKLTMNAQKKAIFSVQKTLSAMGDISVQLFSSLKKTGIDEARKKLDAWLLQ